jgi:hypothetical protein
MAISMQDACWTLVSQDDSTDQPSMQELKTSLEKGQDGVKIETMKKILGLMLNGEPCSQLLMHVIRFVLPSKNKTLKKLLTFYWEICPKKNPDGKLKQEMILVWYVGTTLLRISSDCNAKLAMPCGTTCSLRTNLSGGPLFGFCASCENQSCWSLCCRRAGVVW